jgi:hypothetical protein
MNIYLRLFDIYNPIWTVLNLTNLIIVLVSLIIILREFFYIKQTVIYQKRIVVEKDNKIGILFIFIWILLFIFIKGFFFDPIFGSFQEAFISPLLFSGLVLVTTFFILRTFYPKNSYGEFLLGGIILILVTFFVFFSLQPLIEENGFGGFDDPFDFLRSIMGTDASQVFYSPLKEFYFINSFIASSSFTILGFYQFLKIRQVMKRNKRSENGL